MIRRDFFGALALGLGGVFAPKFGRWHKQGSGVLVRDLWPATITGIRGEQSVIVEITDDGLRYYSEDENIVRADGPKFGRFTGVNLGSTRIFAMRDGVLMPGPTVVVA